MTMGEVALDGRSERRRRSRLAVIHALVALASEGNARPSTAEIAARAGLSPRSVGQIFGTQEALLSATAEVVLRSVVRPFTAPDGSVVDRVEAIVAHRASIAEATAGIRRAIAGVSSLPPVAAAMAEARAARRAEVEDAFADELSDLSRSVRREVLAALEASLSAATWDELRVGLGLSRRASVAAVERTVLGLLAGVLA